MGAEERYGHTLCEIEVYSAQLQAVSVDTKESEAKLDSIFDTSGMGDSSLGVTEKEQDIIDRDGYVTDGYRPNPAVDKTVIIPNVTKRIVSIVLYAVGGVSLVVAVVIFATQKKGGKA